jgi:hypothetical protein
LPEKDLDMSKSIGNENKMFALLVGIDCYLPNKLEGGWYYNSLAGCARDIDGVEEFLRCELSLDEDRIIKLTSTAGVGAEPSESRELWPTYSNIVAAFKKVTGRASSGDVVYIHYSGHGGRAETIYPELKGEKGIDEALVPMDINGGSGRYLRDVEIAYLLKAMVEKALVVTIVLDNCHSASGTRGSVSRAVAHGLPIIDRNSASVTRGSISRAVARGLPIIDRIPRPSESLVAGKEELARTWESLQGGGTRAVKAASGWLLEPKGYTLLAACRSNESAYEYAFHGEEKHGALTYWMLDALKQLGPEMTYKVLHETLLAKIHSQFPEQTPQLEGEGDRVVFGRTEIPRQSAIPVINVDQENRRIELGAGRAQGLRVKARLAIYPRGQAINTSVKEPQALVEITNLTDVSVLAKIIEAPVEGLIEKGAQAVLLDPGVASLRRIVCPVRNAELDKTIDQETPLKKVASCIEKINSGFLQLADGHDTKTPPDFQVAVNNKGEYEIWNPAGVVVQKLSPALKYSDEHSADTLVQRLVHLAKYKNVQELTNNGGRKPLSNKLVVELAGMRSEYDPDGDPIPEMPGEGENIIAVRDGEWVFLRIRNEYSDALNITILDLQPDWGITQIYPSGAAFFETLDQEKEVILPLRTRLPNNYEEATDVVKVFATINTTNFRWLESPPLDNPSRGWTERGMRAPNNALESLFFTFMEEEGPKTRTVSIPAAANGEWTTAQVEIQIVGGRGAIGEQ